MLDRITPLVLTYNEEANIARTLRRLAWARDIVVVDSLSTDQTTNIVQSFPNARLFGRRFDDHGTQWNYGLLETGIASDWVLALDADYELTDDFVAEMRRLDPGDAVAGYRARFQYCVQGRPLRGTAYPPVTVLFRRDRAAYVLDGHTQRVMLDGPVREMHAPIRHDDRKPLSRWFAAQSRYMKLEAEKIASTPAAGLSGADRLRRLLVVAPPAMLAYCLLIKGNVLDGRAGLYYALQRSIAEAMLSLHLLDRRLRSHDERNAAQVDEGMPRT